MASPLPDPSSSVTRLPPECLEIVLHHLRFDSPSLFRLLTVSRQFFLLTVPVLYKNPFHLAARSLDSNTSAPLYPANRYDSGWPRLLIRIKSLTRLLIQNLRLNHLYHIPQQTSIGQQHEWGHNDWEQEGWAQGEWTQGGWDVSRDWDQLSPASTSYPSRKTPPGATRQCVDDSQGWFPEAGGALWNPTNTDSSCDLIRFDDELASQSLGDLTLTNTIIHDEKATLTSTRTEQGSSIHSDDLNLSNGSEHTGQEDHQEPGGSIFADYFSFYTHHNHRLIEPVIRDIFPALRDSDYTQCLNEINLATLRHNTRRIESIHIHDVGVIPDLQSHLDQLERLMTIELHDGWTAHELEKAYQFLKDHTAKFSMSSHCDKDDDDDNRDPSLGTTINSTAAILKQGGYRRSGIRHFQYSDDRNRWTNPGERTISFIQLMKALGPGLESIDVLYYPRRGLDDLKTLDVSSLRSLKVKLTEVPNNDVTFCRPEFLSRCRQLEILELYSNSSDMFSWAVKDWNNNSRKTKTQAQPLVRLQRLRIRVHTDKTVYDILRDALYGFRETLQEIDIHSATESEKATSLWMDHDFFATPYSPLAPSAKWGDLETPDTQDEKRPPESSTRNMNEEECYNKCSSIESGPLLIRWSVSFLTTLALTGPIAAALDMKSLQFMPRLYALSLTIDMRPTDPVNQSIQCPNGSGNRGRILNGITALSYLAPRSLRRVLIAGPWPEISEESLQIMIKVTPGHAQAHIHYDQTRTVKTDRGYNEYEKEKEDDEDNDDDDDDTTVGWGEQLVEFSVVNNPQVTVPGMIRLARQMEQLEVMGTSLNLERPVREGYGGRPLIDSYSIESYPVDDDYGGVRSHTHRDEMITYDLGFGAGMDHRFGKRYRNRMKDHDILARDMITRARLEMPWIDLGPDAKHLGKQN
ncbi:hypothetical protein BGX34_002365 [Mortierella sp. NVP85]|nr:hypothetical protein BGX34_002365 [Mortierella sp. NVP85]